MPVGADRQRRKGPPEPEREAPERERRVREEVEIRRDRPLTQDAAARLQQAVGNLATRALLERPGASGVVADDHTGREEAREETETEAREVERERHRAVPIPARGLPIAPSTTIEGDQQYGGDDDDDPPLPLPDERHPLAFPHANRGNRARLDALRASGRLPPEVARLPLPACPTRGQRRPDAPSPVGDVRFRSPLAAWGDPRLLAGRSLAPEDLVDLAGPGDPLARPLLAAEFVAGHAEDPLARLLAREVARPPGALVAGSDSASLLAATLTGLVVLALAAGPPAEGAVRDRALEVALDEDTLEAVVAQAGDLVRNVPPAHRILERALGQSGESTPAPPLGAAARRWLVPALARAAGTSAIATPPTWEAPVREAPPDPADPATSVDRALAAPGPVPDTEETVAPLVESLGALLAAGGRMQVELAAAALAGRVPGREGVAIRTCRVACGRCQAVAGELLVARARLGSALGTPLPDAADVGQRVAEVLARSREALLEARSRALEDLAALADPGTSTGDAADPSTPDEVRALTVAEAEAADARPEAALGALDAAIEEARVRNDPRLAGRLELAAGILELGRDAASAAEVRLARCGEAAARAGDSLALAVAGLLALPLALARGAWPEVAVLTDRLGRIALPRRNPAVLVAAATGRAATAMALGDPEEGVVALLACSRLLAALGEEAASSLLRARLAEIHDRLGASTFSEVLRRSTARLASAS